MTIDPKNLSATATLTFSDEFNSLSLWNGTSGTWSTKYPFAPEKGGSLPSNGEQEWYINATYAPTDAVNPWTVSNGVLTLTAQPASSSIQSQIDGYQYTSGMINTYNSFSQTYGYFEMRAQLPDGQGLWPAFWLLQTDMSWPPEIDAMEVLGHDMTTLYTAAHTNQTGSHTSQGGTIKVPDMSAGYHTYGVDWQADYITYYFDGAEVWKTATPSDMHEPMYMIANLAVGGYWPGMVDGTTDFPAQMKIDYIRAYTEGAPSGGGANPPAGGGGTSDPPPDRPDRPDRPARADRPDRPDRANAGQSDDDTNDGGGRPARPDRAERPDRSDRADRPDRTDATHRDDTHDGRDRPDTIRAERDDTHDSAIRHLADRSAGSDSFVFNRKAVVQGDDSGTDQILSSHADRAGSSRFDFDSDDAAGTADHSAALIAALDHVQMTGVNTHAHTDWLH